MEEKKLFINGEFIDSTDQDWIQVENPRDKSIIGRVPAASEVDVNRAVQGARGAQGPWQDLGLDQRIAFVKKMVAYLEAHREEIAKTISLELGCPLDFARNRQFMGYIDNMKDYISIAKAYPFVERKEGYEIHHEPVGLVAALTPWNYPFGQIVKKVIPALLTGSCVLLKPSKSTPLTAYYFAEAAKEAQLPAGVFQLLPGRGGEVGNLLARHPDINMISFTGSTQGGKEVAKLALDTVKRLTLELGGKSPALLLPEGDIDLCVRSVLDTVFLNTGQTCSAKTRLLAPRFLKAPLEVALVREAKTYRFGDDRKGPVDVGPLQSAAQLAKVQKYIALGKKEAEVLYEDSLDLDYGYYQGPVIFTEVDPDSPLAQDEIFGPVLSVIYYESEEEAIEIANNSLYGLSGMVFGPREEALRLAKKIKTGQVQINKGKFSQNAPFGGFKESGLGREGGRIGLEEYLETKTIFIGD